MTGCYPPQTGVTANGQELDPDFPSTCARVFAAAGYRTVQIGKLHFQCHEDHDLDPRARHSYGFEVFQLSEESGCYEDAYRTWLRGEYPEQVGNFTVPRPGSLARHRERHHYQVLDAPWECSHSGWVGEQAIRYLNSWGTHKEPQFIHLGFYAPHPPLNPTREMFEPYSGKDLGPLLRREGDPRDPKEFSDEQLQEYRRHFYAMVTGVDMAVGKLLAELEAMGQLDDTLIVFGSDHGDACGDHGRIGKSSVYLDGIMRLPLVLHWPNGLGRNARRVPALVEMVDVLPTLAELSGIPRHPFFQGLSYAPALLDGSEIQGREDVFAYHGRGDLHLRTPTHRYLAYFQADGAPREMLFDLTADPDEFEDLAADAGQNSTLRELRDRAFQRVIGATRSVLPRRCRF